MARIKVEVEVKVRVGVGVGVRVEVDAETKTEASLLKLYWLFVLAGPGKGPNFVNVEVEVEYDNALLVDLLLAGGGDNSNLVKLRLLHQRRRWKIRIHHILRNHNGVTDQMAKCTATGSSSLQVLDDPPATAKGYGHVY
ncbi:hypothetical protein J1N35_006401 [Gossypium stocksii]|uniref:RNase H type-1 domain-containing protein n=1 Tax=Gossypium stocksii TaxID=47602 RepID=A0A9D3WGT8_9ROSI|nr:hypothetical protein J1N35_006401 [Gossypium stocksii]